jgi:hypothetical protein
VSGELHEISQAIGRLESTLEAAMKLIDTQNKRIDELAKRVDAHSLSMAKAGGVLLVVAAAAGAFGTKLWAFVAKATI